MSQTAIAVIMEQAQVFASTYSLVGGRFDDGSKMQQSEDEKAELHRLIAAAIRPSPPQNVAGIFDGAIDADTPLQAAAREAGWALTELIDISDWQRRDQLQDIIDRLATALIKGDTAPEIENGRFQDWSLEDFAGQCRMQAREMLDPEYAQFMGELAKRLRAVVVTKSANTAFNNLQLAYDQLVAAASTVVVEEREFRAGKPARFHTSALSRAVAGLEALLPEEEEAE